MFKDVADDLDVKRDEGVCSYVLCLPSSLIYMAGRDLSRHASYTSDKVLKRVLQVFNFVTDVHGGLESLLKILTRNKTGRFAHMFYV